MSIPTLRYLTTLPLVHQGDCSLLGVTSELTVYVEEIYGDGWLAQHAVNMEGQIIESVDENAGENLTVAPLELPTNLYRPQKGWHTMSLNFTGPRHRGLRGPERLIDLVHPIAIGDKMALVKQCNLPIAAPMLLGIAESYVLAEAALVYPNVFIVCRRVRLAYALEKEQLDTDDQPYDYDTLVIYAAHLFDRTQDEEVNLADLNTSFPGVHLHRPMDCLIMDKHLFIADGGETNRTSAIHVWQIEAPPPASNTNLNQKIYG